ncbi:MAG TPA: 30S ribosomal protein S11 [Patescibacteria group bacterium]|nr:30S ribosomal protein S11 [Patescibacteria group bacterium]
MVEKPTSDAVVDEKAEEKVEEGAKKTKRKKKGAKSVAVGNAYVKATFNNTIVTITDLQGNVLASGSAGSMGYSGSKKSTPYVAGLISNAVATKVKGFGMGDINVYVNGIGSGRESAVRALQSSGLNITTIKDITPLPHNGCKRPRPRRV